MQRSMEREAADEYLAISRVLAEFGEPELQEKYAQEASTIYARLARDEPGAADLPRVEPLGPEGHSPFFDDPVIFGDLELEAQLTDDVHQAARAAVEQSEVEPSDQDVASLYDLEIRESEFADPLRDVLFYVDNGFIAEAQDLLAELKRRYGQDGEIASRLDELEARTRLLAEAQGLTASAPSADLPVSEVEATDGNELSPEDQQVQDLFQEFQRSIHAQLGAQDYKTHYDLGLAYREMALFDEAIREFEIAVQDSQLYLEACSLLGLCWMDKGDPRGAIEWFERGLAGRGQADKAQGLLYYLGTAYEQAGDFEGAKSSFAKLLELDPNFRDVQKKARDLGL
jgi:tetratricopeptide (TPR) repeat protein